MATDDSDTANSQVGQLTDALIRVGVIATLALLSLQVITPFANLLMWALILAIALYPLHLRLMRHLGGKSGRSATLLVVGLLLLIGGPTIMLGASFASHARDGYTALENNSVSIPAPAASVAEWPIVGKRLYGAWSAAAQDLPTYIENNQEQFQSLSKRGLAAAANTAGSLLQFLGALIVAGIIMAYGQSGGQAVERILVRFTDPTRGKNLQNLATATVRSVATGVIGVAFIQALLLGVGFMLAGIPAAGVLAVVVMLVGILQLPALIISIPAIAYLWWSGDASTTSNVIYSVYLLVAGTADNVLKPILLGRGVDAPMPVILIGALGGMVASGIIGLFVGAVLLAVAYQIFMEWVSVSSGGTEDAHSSPSDQTAPVSE